MRYIELYESPVLSSWIEDLEFVAPSRVIMTLLNGYQYTVGGVNRALYTQWMSAPSKGKFWHRRIKNRKIVRRIA